jgi:hypothetical protein
MDTQIVGAFGERAAEAELLRRGWRTANFNTSIKNSKDYDLVAIKGERIVHLRIKTCGPGWNAFQFSSKKEGLSLDNLLLTDFTVLIKMGGSRQEDVFYVTQTLLLWEQINAHRHTYLEQPRRDGAQRRNLGHWTLHLRPIGRGEDRPNYGFESKWAHYRDAWESLDA